MMYKYRWLIAGLLAIILIWVSYVTDILPNKIKYQQLVEEKTKLEIGSQAKKIDRAWSYAVDDVNVLQLTQLIEQAGLKVLSVQSQTLSSAHIGLMGPFAAWQAFVNGLSKKSRLINLKNINIKLSDTHDLLIDLEVDLSLSRVELMDYPMELLNPFCDSESILAFSSDDDLRALQETPLNEMKMLGYLAEGDHVVAWIGLSNSALVEISQSMVIGKEKAKVVGIEPGFVSLILPDLSSFVLASRYA